MAHFDRSRLVRGTFTLPTSLLAEVDRRAGRRGRSRYIAEAVAQRVRREAQRSALNETAGAAGVMSPDEVARWIERIRGEADG